MAGVEISGGAIRIAGKPTQIISGTIHYFRIRPEQWRDRIAKAKMMGLNAVETYVCHNLHEPKPGQFDFAGMLDLEAFLDEIHRAGLYAIVRPGPYICAEWENGGLPAWLSARPGVEFRCMNPAFLAANDRYLNTVLPLVKKHLYTAGGPVIMLQIENEYGSYGNDKAYLRHVRQICLDNGIDVPLFTSDGPDDWMLQGGTIPECFQTVNFGSRSAEAFAQSRKYRPEGPDFCMEFWNGWFDHWGEEHHTRAADDVAQELDAMLKTGASVNFFVFCGGTNFGFTAGANGNGDRPGDYAPTVTSYDYDGPLTEWGDPTPKFFACQEVIRKYRPDAPFGTPSPVRKAAYGKAELTESARCSKRSTGSPQSMNRCGRRPWRRAARTSASSITARNSPARSTTGSTFRKCATGSWPGRTGAISGPSTATTPTVSCRSEPGRRERCSICSSRTPDASTTDRSSGGTARDCRSASV